jgi:hypothetical protein
MSKQEKVGARKERDEQEAWSRNIREGNPHLNIRNRSDGN